MCNVCCICPSQHFFHTQTHTFLWVQEHSSVLTLFLSTEGATDVPLSRLSCGASAWNDEEPREYLRHIHHLLSRVVEPIMSAETLVTPPSAHLREYVYFIYTTCHVR